MNGLMAKLLIRYRGGKVGDNVTIRRGLRLSGSKKIVIGNHCYIGPEAYIHAVGGVIIHDGVIIGPRVTVHSSNHNFKESDYIPYDAKINVRRVEIGRGTWIGDSVMIAPGVRIGKGCIIGMGVVVNRDVPDFSIVYAGGINIKKRSENDIYRFNNNLSEKRFYLEWKKMRKKS